MIPNGPGSRTPAPCTPIWPDVADVALLEVREGNFEFLDNYEGKRAGKQRLFPIETVIGVGYRVP